MFVRTLVALVFSGCVLALSAAPALADTPSPTPTSSIPPTGSPTSPSPRASSTAGASATPSAGSPVNSPSPSPSDAASANDASAAAALQAAQDALQATSLLERIQAMERYLAAELDALDAHGKALDLERSSTKARLSTTEAQIADEQRHLDELLRTEYRQSRTTPLEELLGGGSIIDGLVRVAQLSELEAERRDVVAHLLSLRSDLDAERARLDRDAADVAVLQETTKAKGDAMSGLEARAQRLVAAQGQSDAARTRAEVEVVAELADEQARASQELLDVVAKLVPNAVVAQLRWTWPTAGALSQSFGPSALTLEPPFTYRGVTYPHFHPGIDVAAPLFTPVVAAGAGRVSFVGHFSDGAMLVLIAHADGFVTMYAHLDDGFRPPMVHVGDSVAAGQVIGTIGLTGITTGPHLHFEVLQGAVPLDPLTVLPPR